MCLRHNWRGPLFHLEYLRTIFHLQHNWQDWKLSCMRLWQADEWPHTDPKLKSIYSKALRYTALSYSGFADAWFLIGSNILWGTLIHLVRKLSCTFFFINLAITLRRFFYYVFYIQCQKYLIIDLNLPYQTHPMTKMIRSKQIWVLVTNRPFHP